MARFRRATPGKEDWYVCLRRLSLRDIKGGTCRLMSVPGQFDFPTDQGVRAAESIKHENGLKRNKQWPWCPRKPVPGLNAIWQCETG